MLGVSDIPRALAFYRDTLGFEQVRAYAPEGKCLWALAKTGLAELMFYFEPAKPRTSVNTVYLYFYAQEVAVMHRVLAEKGYAVTPLRVTFYGMKEFGLTDPEGYEWLVGEGTAEPPTDGS